MVYTYTLFDIFEDAYTKLSFAKTKLIAPAESETLTVEFDINSMASYDMNKAAWVLEKGNYKIHIAHDIRDFEKTYNYYVGKSVVYKTDSKSGHRIENLFEFASSFNIGKTSSGISRPIELSRV